MGRLRVQGSGFGLYGVRIFEGSGWRGRSESGA